MDLSLLAMEPELVISHLRSRRSAENMLDDVYRIGTLRSERKVKIAEGNDSKSKRNTLSQDIGKLMKDGKSADDEEVLKLKQEVADASSVSALCDHSLLEIDYEIAKIMLCIPNLLHDDVPDGSDETNNVEVRNWGSDLRKIGIEGAYSWHDDIALRLGGLNLHAAAKMSGARFSVLLGPLARMERALISYCIDFQAKRGYTEVSVPYIVSRSSLVGTGQLPKFEQDLFKVNHSVAGEDAFVIPTSEVPVTNMYREEILDVSQLPIRHVCGSPSFRAEAGSHGRDTRGLLRQHQFHKVELVKIVSPEASEDEHLSMVRDAEAVLESLGLPYRTMLLCSGDIGFSAHKCYDIEVWLPGQQIYKEISSVSNCHDFQARRMSLRYRPVPRSSLVKGSKATAFPHTINGSGLAIGRTLVAILENYQLPDGSVEVPDALRPYMGGQTVLSPIH